MTLTPRQTRANAATFNVLGQAASWGAASIACSIIVHDADVTEPIGTIGHVVARGIVLRVQQSDVAAPAKGDQVSTALGDRYQVIAAPQLTRSGIWICEAKAL